MTEQPRELQELNARIERLRERLNRGDADMTSDEIQAAIERAEAKARELEGLGSAAMPAMRVDPARDLQISRLIKAPRPAVWRAWTDRTSFEQWWVPAPAKCEVQ